MAVIGSVASTIAVLQLTSVVTGACYNYMLAVKGTSKDLTAIINEIRSLESILLRLQDLDETPGEADSVSLLGLVKAPDGPLRRCHVELEHLSSMLRSSLASQSAEESGIKRAGGAIMWPLKQKSINRSLDILRREKETLNLALVGDANATLRSVKVEVQSIFAAQKDEQHHAVLQWLMVTDPSVYHVTARRKHEPATGSWFLDDKRFDEWKIGKSRFIWIHGIPGCGKSILCSSIIEATATCCADHPEYTMAYFYFDFNDAEKGQLTRFLSSLIGQLCSRVAIVPGAVQMLYNHHSQHGSTPSLKDLLKVLRELTKLCTRTFLIVDALDECNERRELLDLLRTIAEWEENRLSILTTSRKERDIELVLERIVSKGIGLQTSHVQTDIRKFVCSRILSDARLNRWPAGAKKEMETSLVGGAHGMFRWVVCQLESLQSCVTPAALKRALSTLPKTLPETYDRILMGIDEEYRGIAMNVLHWLAFALRPLALDQVAEALAVRPGTFSIDPDDRFMDPRDILTICSSLITTTHDGDSSEKIRLAHYSVKEYLVSERIRSGPAAFYGLSEKSANSLIARACLTYCITVGNPPDGWESATQKYPLISYASPFWAAHAQRTSGNEPDSELVTLALLCYDGFSNGSLATFDRNKQHWCLQRSPLYHASFGGFIDAVRAILDRGDDPNCRGGFDEFSLICAARMGHVEIVTLLLQHGAIVDAENENALRASGGSLRREAGSTEIIRRNCMRYPVRQHQHGTALHTAAEWGHVEVVKVLISAGANVNTIDTYDYSTPIHRATANGHERVVRLLLDHRADPDIKGRFGASLALAARGRHTSIAKLLIERGADTNSFCAADGYPLISAAHSGDKEIIRLFLDHGANVNATGGRYGNALSAAIYSHEKTTDTADVISLLLDHGAGVNASINGYHGRPLYLASKRSLLGLMRTFIDSGADVNTHGGGWATALIGTAWDFGNRKAMLLLLDSGADVNVVTESDGTALECAIAIGDEESIELLLDRGADLALTTRECRISTPLQIAVRCCSFSRPSLQAVVLNAKDLRSLLRTSTGLDDIAGGGSELDKALKGAATSSGSEGRAMEILLEEVPSLATRKNQKLERALIEAARAGSHAVVKLLLNKGVSPDATDMDSDRDRGDTALQVAWKYSFKGASEEHNAVIVELLGRGAKGEWSFSSGTKHTWVDLTRWAKGK